MKHIFEMVLVIRISCDEGVAVIVTIGMILCVFLTRMFVDWLYI